MKYSILLPYLRRPVQFRSALSSLRQYAGRDDWELIIVADDKNTRQDLVELYTMAAGFPALVLTAEERDPRWISQTCHFNQAARIARGEFLIISNPETYHAADVLAGLDAEFAADPGCYVVCACQSLHDTAVGPRLRPHMWYQHSVHNPRDLHFCTALSAERFRQAGGFDEEFRFGIAYDDDDFREAVRSTGARFVRRDDLLTYHLHHDRSNQHVADYAARLERNRKRYAQKWGKG